ncbi:MAG: hypothetical protein AAF617_06375 [Bacteroidota bacterium]
MKKKHIKSLTLVKKSIANITATNVKGGWTTIGNITNSCPHKCGSQQR